MITKENKAKIAKCLELSMEIEGASMDYHPTARTVNVFKIVDGKQLWELRAWWGFDSTHSLDKLIDDLSNMVTVQNLSNETASH